MACIGAGRNSDYQYNKHELDQEGTIRLLNLTPGSRRDELVAEFKTSDVDHPTDDYESLSYTWGRSGPSKRLWIRYDKDGVSKVAKLGIRKNLWQALRALRLTYAVRTLWIDAVCINQEDPGEKKRQIAMMGRIYSASSRTVVYLGEKIPNIEFAVEDLQTVVLFTCMQAFNGLNTIDITKNGANGVLAKMLVNIWRKAWYLPFSQAWAAAITQTKQRLRWYKENRATLNTVHRWWRAWIALFSCPWFRRAWVAQEFVMAQELRIQTGKEIICGDGADADLDDFKAILLQMSLLGPGCAPRNRDEYVPHLYGTRNLLRLYELRSTYQTVAHKPSLLSILGFFRNYDATDPHDKLYAFLGLSREAHEPSLVPEYEEHLHKTLLRYATFLVSQPNGIQVLYDFRCGHFTTGLPSWVPLWTEAIDSRNLWIPWMTYLEPLHGGELAAQAAFRASGLSSTRLRVAGDDPVRLLARGVAIDKIAHVGHVLLTSKQRAEKVYYGQSAFLLAFYDELDTIVGNADGIHVPPGQTLQEVKWRTLRGDCADYTREDLASMLEEHEREKTALRTNNVAEMAQLMREMMGNARTAGGTMLPWQVTRLHAYDSKKLGLTENGHVCLVPHSTDAGDTVCVLAGSAVPHVLRTVKNSTGASGLYQLLGTAYVHGVMRGECIEEQELETNELVLV
ncbi:heterokaryon incompatibility protein-domain-containing protein [Diaporthe sp. PMI_573]|nr:heterokaryon incompatibility protein-domain-containing protein [Diaporthaceae sp. PMI_573]